MRFTRRMMATSITAIVAAGALGLGSTALADGSTPNGHGGGSTQLQGTTAKSAPNTQGAPAATAGKQTQGPFKLDSKGQPQAPKATQVAPKGATKYVKTDATGKLKASGAIRADGVTPDVGNVAYVDFTTPYNYCQRGLTYTPVSNTSGVTQYYQVVLYNGSSSRYFYGSINTGTTAYPSFYGVTGSWYAYLYVWNGSSYIYDEYLSSANNCSVSVTFTTNSGYTGYLKYTIVNHGNAYATVQNRQLAPFGYSGTYTGVSWAYPAPYGGTVVQYKYVGTGRPYGVFQDLDGAMFYSPWWQYGQL